MSDGCTGFCLCQPGIRLLFPGLELTANNQYTYRSAQDTEPCLQL